MTKALRTLTLTALAAPLALGLAACKNKDDSPLAALTGEAIAKIAAPAGKSWGETVVKTDEGGFRMGNPDAPIKLVEYGSTTCSHCMEFSELSAAEMRDNFVASGRVSYEFRNFIRDPLDLTITMLNRCGPPEGFFARTEQGFGNLQAMSAKLGAVPQEAQKAAMDAPAAQRTTAIAQMAGLFDFYAARGIAREQGAACLANTGEASELARRTNEDAQTYTIEGTPTFLINGQKVDVNTWPLVKAELERRGAR